MADIEPIERMTARLARLPGIGRKTAQRLCYHILSMPEADVRELAEAIWQGKKRVKTCAACGNYAQDELCVVCRDPERDGRVLCVVRDPRDVAAIERMRDYRGRYHVLHGIISPMEHVSPEDIRIKELVQRVRDEAVQEVILATNPDIEGEATAAYIARLLRPSGVKLTRIARGVPIGGDLEYTDEITLLKAMEGRLEV